VHFVSRIAGGTGPDLGRLSRRLSRDLPLFLPPRHRALTLAAPSPMFWTYLGIAIILLVVGQLVVGLLVTLRRNRIAAERSALEIARFTEELAAVRDSRRKVAQEPVPWNGFRKFVVRRKVEE